jgi:hypothetical protein
MAREKAALRFAVIAVVPGASGAPANFSRAAFLSAEGETSVETDGSEV